MTLTKKNPGDNVKVPMSGGIETKQLPVGVWAVVDDNNVVVGGKAYTNENKAKAAVLGLELID